ncbi:MAG: rod shape-determining protein MreC [Gammaproteobacteria bacterium]
MSAVGGNVGNFGRGNVPLGLRFLLIAIISCSLMILDHREAHLSRIRQAFSVVVYPIQLVVDLPFTGWRWATRSLSNQTSLLEENAQLKRERLDVSVRLQRLAALEAENNRLRAMLDSSAHVSDRVLVAEILAVDLDPYRQRFTINRGLNDSVYVGQALLDADGVVGQIVRADLLTSEAVLISDADHALPVAINRNGLRTIVVGTGDSARLRLPYLTNSADIEQGDLLVSSGLGGVFPSGYPVGRVLEVRRQPGQSFAQVIAEPAARLDRDREVLLVWTADDTADDPGATGIAEAP